MDTMSEPHGTSNTWQPVTDEVLRTLIVGDMASVRVGGTIRIFCGAGNPSVFDESFAAAARHLFERGARIRIIAGPVLATNKNGENAVIRLFQEGVVEQLLFRQTRWAEQHFRVMETDNGYSYSVEPQQIERALTTGRHVVSGAEEHPSLPDQAEAAAVYFDDIARTLTDSVESETRLPILLTETEIHHLRVAALQRGLRFEHLLPGTIQLLRRSTGSAEGG